MEPLKTKRLTTENTEATEFKELFSVYSVPSVVLLHCFRVLVVDLKRSKL